MAITQEFMEAVQSGKILRVRIMLKDSLLVDPTAAQFEELERYANGRMGDIYVEHDGERLNFDNTAWNKDYLNRQMVAVVNNFSKERVDLLKRMVRYLYKDKIKEVQREGEQVQRDQGITRKQVGIGVTAAGGVLAVAGICASHTVLTVGGIVVAAVGVGLIVSDKEDS